MSTRKLVGYEPNPCDSEPLPVYEDQFSAAPLQPAAQPEQCTYKCEAWPECGCGPQPEQPEPGVLTDKRIKELAVPVLNINFYDLPAWLVPLARAIEREVLSTRKLLDQEPLNAAGETPAQHAHRWATELAISMARKLYPEVQQFEPLPDLLGVITQIDNMVTGLQRKRTAEQNARIMEAVKLAISNKLSVHEVERLLRGEA